MTSVWGGGGASTIVRLQPPTAAANPNPAAQIHAVKLPRFANISEFILRLTKTTLPGSRGALRIGALTGAMPFHWFAARGRQPSFDLHNQMMLRMIAINRSRRASPHHLVAACA